MRKRTWWTAAGASAAGVAAIVGVAVATPASANDAANGTRSGRHMALTEEQKSCLDAAGLTKPEGRPTAEQRAAFEAAAAKCGITLPQRGDHAGNGDGSAQPQASPSATAS